MTEQATRIILADDHDLVRAGIRNALQDLDNLAIIAEVGNGVELMQALAGQPADLLIMDINMPGFEPLAEIHHIRTQYPHLRILIVSAYDDDIYVQGLLRAGAAIAMASLTSGMNLMSIGISYQYMVRGAVLAAAVIFDVATRNRS
ncbi:MAG: response regulator [Chloroflexi bacterium]|nr:response regulator [Chloroflexota bacterium]